jgi:MFS family permease
LRTGLAVFPSGLIVAILAPRIAAPLVGRFGTTRVILTGILSTGIGYALFLRIDLHSNYATTMLPTFVFVGLGFALAYGPLNIAATNGIDASEQGLAGGLVNTSFQFGGALVLAVVAAVYSASVDTATSPSAVLNGFHHALIVPLIAAIAGAAVTATGLREQR